MLIIFALLLCSCTNQQETIPKTKTKSKSTSQKHPPTSVGGKWKLPISVPSGEFDKVVGWLTDDQILYVTNLEQTSNVYSYNLSSGKSNLIYQSDSPIVNVEISPSKKYMLIHSSPSSYEGLISIIDINGLVKMKKTVASYELDFQWNPYNDFEVLVTKFAEDWSFQVLLLNIKDDAMTELSLPQPFNKWVDANQIAYLNWDENNPTLFAPLIFKGLDTGSERTIFPSVFQFSTFSNLLMTISVNEQNQSIATYSFFEKENKKVFSFSIPQLTKFSDWLVPFYDYNERKNQFITLAPLTSGEVDSYSEGFELVSYNIKKGSQNQILTGVENQPLSLSPSGEASLYGNQLEKVIDLQAKKIYELIKE